MEIVKLMIELQKEDYEMLMTVWKSFADTHVGRLLSAIHDGTILNECKHEAETLVSLDAYKDVCKELAIAMEQLHKLGEKKECKTEECITVNTQGLDEGIRCAMCTNTMANDRGCDGACRVDDAMYNKVLKVIRDCTVPSVYPTTKENLMEVDHD